MKTNDTAGRPDEELDALSLIRKDHIRIIEQLEELLAVPGRARRRRCARLLTLLAAHESMEREVFYPALGRHEDGAGIVRECQLEHHAADSLARRLFAYEADDSSWTPTARALEDAIRRHFEHEQDALLPLARRIFDSGELHKLATAMREQRLSRQTQVQFAAHEGDRSQPSSEGTAQGPAGPAARPQRGPSRTSHAR